ncbi:MAG: hypothetical protein GY809_16660, partial [Planctomycetes bacterium]|nr:hypothetical protein [Planctomycetota bacterium]
MTRLPKHLKRSIHGLFWPPARMAAVLVIAGLVWRVGRWAAGFPLWGDEAFIAVNFLTRDFLDHLTGQDHTQVVPLGFLWVTHAFRLVMGPSEQVLRLFSILAGIASLLLMWWWAPRALSRRQGYLAVTIFAASYYPVRHSNEVKHYAVDLLVSLIFTILAWWCAQDLRRRGPWLALAAAAILAPWFSYTCLFVCAGVVMVLAVRLLLDSQVRSSVGLWLGVASVALLGSLSYLTMWKVIGHWQSVANAGLSGSEHWLIAFPPAVGTSLQEVLTWPLRLGAWLLDAHTGNMMAYPAGGKNGGSTFTTLLVLAGIVTLWRRRGPLLALLLAPAGLSLLASFAGKYPYGSTARTMLFLAPAICMLAGTGALSLLRRLWGPRGAVGGARIFTVVMLVIVVAGAVDDIREPYKHVSDNNCRAAICALAEEGGAGQRWVVVGDLVDTPWAPNMIGWGGNAARMRHNLDPDPAPLAGRFSGTMVGGLADLRRPFGSELA